jgi:hypothetical protein
MRTLATGEPSALCTILLCIDSYRFGCRPYSHPHPYVCDLSCAGHVCTLMIQPPWSSLVISLLTAATPLSWNTCPDHAGALGRSAQAASGGEAETPAASRPAAHSPSSVTLAQAGMDDRSLPPTPDVRLYHRAVVVAQENTGAGRVKCVIETNCCASMLFCNAALRHLETSGGVVTACSCTVTLTTCAAVVSALMASYLVLLSRLAAGLGPAAVDRSV